MDYLVVEIWVYLLIAFAIGFLADRLILILGPARGPTGDRVAIAENLAATRDAEARQLRSEIETARERLRIAEAETAAAQSDVTRANTLMISSRTDFTRKIMALEEEIAALKRPRPAPAPEPVRAVEPTPSQTATPPAPKSFVAPVASVPPPMPVQVPKPTTPAPPPASLIQDAVIEVEPLPLVASMEVPSSPPAATVAAVAPTPAPAAPISVPPPTELPPDDLKEIVGIGPILEHTLQSLGLKTFAQIATITPEDIAMLIVKVDSSIAERVLRERWVEQARELYAKKYGKAAA
jgi:predicted flap endonuclease-1-like 5' DNA nuclease